MQKIYLLSKLERQKRERDSIHCFILQMPTITMAGPDKLHLGLSCEGGTQILESQPTAFQGWQCQELHGAMPGLNSGSAMYASEVAPSAQDCILLLFFFPTKEVMTRQAKIFIINICHYKKLGKYDLCQLTSTNFSSQAQEHQNLPFL